MRAPLATLQPPAERRRKLQSDPVSVLILGLSALVIVAAGLLLLDSFSGDSTIYLVYARNVARGDPFSFNPGQFSSGATSPVWPILLGVAFWLPHSVAVAKLIGVFATLVALAATYSACRAASRSNPASALALVPILWLLTIPGLLLFESPLVVVLVDASVLLLLQIARSGFKLRLVDCLAVGAVWTFLPLVRPDAAAIVTIEFAAMLLVMLSKRWFRSLSRLIPTALAAALPSLSYFGYSYFRLGYPSVSSFARAAALSDGVPHVLGLAYSFSALDVFLLYPYAITAPFVLLGWHSWVHHHDTRWFALMALAAVAAYLLIMTIILPVGGAADRYVLPVVPFWAIFASAGLSKVGRLTLSRTNVLLPLGMACLFIGPLLGNTVNSVLRQRSRGFTFDVITEKAIVDYLNLTALPGSTVLTYDVQDRFFLRSDIQVLSLDGITDGRIMPYLNSPDLSDFLWKYKPRYWLANDAVKYRPYLAHSILHTVTNLGPSAGDATTVKGITFRNLRSGTAATDPSFAAYQQLYELTYDSEPSGYEGNV